MNRWLITPGVLAVALAASVSPAADTQRQGEGEIVSFDDVPIYNWGQSAAACAEVQGKAVKLGQTIEQVDQILGAPEKTLKAGTEVIYVYQDLEITFENGEITDLQSPSLAD